MRKASAIDPDDWMSLDAEPADEPGDSGAGIIVTKQRLCTITGLWPASLDKAFKAGAPIVAKGTRREGWKINTADFFGWYVANKVSEVEGGDPDKQSFDQAKAAKTNAEARLKEMQLARLEGVTITIDEAVQLYREEATVIRSQLLAMPGRLAVMVAAESDPVMIEAMIADEINIALSNITGDRPDTWRTESEDDRDRREDDERNGVRQGAESVREGTQDVVQAEESFDSTGMGGPLPTSEQVNG